jgi:hypothetical protein
MRAMNPNSPLILDEESPADVLAALPSAGVEISRLIGLPAALALIRDFGGQTMVFPLSKNGPGADKFRAISASIGDDAVTLLARHFGGENTYIPRAAKALRMLRNISLIRDFDVLSETLSSYRAINELSCRYRLTSRTIEQVVNGKPQSRRVHRRVNA